MSLKVYGAFSSPPFRAVMMCAKVLGIDLKVQTIDFINGEHLGEAFTKINPQHTIPLLEDDGFVLADSHAINGYLMGKFGKEHDHLYPKNDIQRRALIDHRLHLDSSIIAAKGLQITRPLNYHRLKPTQQSLDDLKEAFGFLEKQLDIQNSNYIVGNTLSIADFSITTTVTSWGYFVPNWPQEFPKINAYIERMKQEEWYPINEEGLKRLHYLFGEVLKKL